MADRLSPEEIENRRPPGWTREGDTLVKTFEFDDYLDGVSFAAEVGELAEAEFHHPKIVIEYETVDVQFTTHETGGITERDIEMAELVSDLR